MTPIRRLLPASGIRAVFDRAKEIEQAGHPVLHLEIGRPDWKMPPGIVEEAKRALDDGFVHYIANRGLLELRAAIAEDIFLTTSRKFNPETELIVTSGVSEAWSMCGLALLGSGDEVIIPQPAWSHYQAVVELAGATPVPLSLSAADGFLIDPGQLEKAITPRTRMAIINTPGNPSGAVQPAETVAEIARLALKYGIFVFADEIYSQFVYNKPHVSIAEYLGDSELLLYANGFSKNYAMTGWRIGYIAADARISDALNRIHQYLTVCGTAFAQKGAAKLLRNPERQAYLDEMRQAFTERYTVWRDAFVDCPGIELVSPNGAIYIFPRIEYRGMSGRDFCQMMLEKYHIAMIPGEIFGQDYGQHVRISFGRELDTQQIAAARLVDLLQTG